MNADKIKEKLINYFGRALGRLAYFFAGLRKNDEHFSITDINEILKQLSLIDRIELHQSNSKFKIYVFQHQMFLIVHDCCECAMLMAKGELVKSEKKKNRMMKRYYKVVKKMLNVEERKKINLIRSN